MHIDIRILVFKPTIMTASEPPLVFVPYPQPVQLAAPHRKLGLASFCRALFALAFWWVVIGLCVRLM
jgi:hypothetical protein